MTLQIVNAYAYPSRVTGCGTVYSLHSTLALVRQEGFGERHMHKVAREIYYCIAGEGLVDYGDVTYSITAGDVVDIAPTIPHALHAAPGKFVEILVMSYPFYSPEDNYPMQPKPLTEPLKAVGALPLIDDQVHISLVGPGAVERAGIAIAIDENKAGAVCEVQEGDVLFGTAQWLLFSVYRD